MLSLPDNCKIVWAFPNQMGGAINGDWVCLKGYAKATLILSVTNGADVTATRVRVDKATTAAAGDESTSVTLANYWYLNDQIAAAPVSDTYVKGASAAFVDSGTTALYSSLIIIDIDPAELGYVSTTPFAKFDWLQATIVSSNAAHFLSATWILYNARYGQDAISMLTAIA